MATTALIAHIAAAKYAWQSTLYRQAQILAGHGVVVDRQTLARWMGSAAWMAKGLYDLQLKTMHRFERLFCDETPMPVLDPGRGRTKVCQFWAHATDDRPWKGPAPPAVAYVFAGGRGKKEIMTQLAGFEGVLQVDGYAAYASLAGDAKMSGKIRLAYCLVHARRNFVKVHKTTNSPFAREVIERIGAVYVIEEGIRGLDADERRAVRQAETKPLMEALKARLVAVKDGISRRSTLIKAIDYMLERWEGLTAFLDDGRLEPDTNTVERSIRPIAMRESLCAPSSSICKHWKRVRVDNATRATFTGHRRFHRLRRQVVGSYLMRSAGNNLHGMKDARFDHAPNRMVCDA